jgi:hypothetical protein
MNEAARKAAHYDGNTTIAPSFSQDVHWYKDAVIYEVHVRAFFDSSGDGIGDFAGLTQKLDYIQELGVNTIWLLPFYPSPGKDDGYDIADYHNIHPQYGTIAEFRRFVREVHKRGLRVITELVINHTSDQHPWFQAARHAPAGSEKRSFYVWSDDPKLYSGTRIIFTDTETSNWTWDPVAKSYFWHRFFSHQPDLNFDNPHVERAVTKTMRFWLDMGVDVAKGWFVACSKRLNFIEFGEPCRDFFGIDCPPPGTTQKRLERRLAALGLAHLTRNHPRAAWTVEGLVDQLERRRFERNDMLRREYERFGQVVETAETLVLGK